MHGDPVIAVDCQPGGEHVLNKLNDLEGLGGLPAVAFDDVDNHPNYQLGARRGLDCSEPLHGRFVFPAQPLKEINIQKGGVTGEDNPCYVRLGREFGEQAAGGSGRLVGLVEANVENNYDVKIRS